jgi:dienelactone hydrolase
MAEIVLFHHVQGLTPGVEALGQKLRAAGHEVHVPDLFEGRRFSSIPEGIAHLTALGFHTVLGRGKAAVEALPGRLVYIGISMGALPSQLLAQTRPGALGAVLLESFIPVSEFGGWPEGLPVQIHGMEHDPEFAGSGDLDAARAFAAERKEAELFIYPGDRHLFTDESLPGWDAAAAGVMLERVLAFLAQVEQ